MVCAAPPPHVLTWSLAYRWARLRPRDRSRARTSPHGPRRAPPSSLSPRPAFASLRRRSQGDARQVLPGTEVARGKAKAKAKATSRWCVIGLLVIWGAGPLRAQGRRGGEGVGGSDG